MGTVPTPSTFRASHCFAHHVSMHLALEFVLLLSFVRWSSATSSCSSFPDLGSGYVVGSGVEDGGTWTWTVTCDTGYENSFGNTGTFECSTGSDGAAGWALTEPSFFACLPQACGSFDDYENNSAYEVTGSGEGHGDTLSLSCVTFDDDEDDDEVTGYCPSSGSTPETVTCSYGSWSTVTLVCDPCDCPAYDNITDAYTLVSDGGNSHGDSVTIACTSTSSRRYDVTYGSSPTTIRCSYGEWGNRSFDCAPAACDEFPDLNDDSPDDWPAYDYYNEDGSNVHGAARNIKCATGYSPAMHVDVDDLRMDSEGMPYEIVECKYGSWEERELFCEPTNCSLFPDLGTPYVVSEGGNAHGDDRVLSCAPGHEPVAGTSPVVSQCLYGVWQLGLHCAPSKCGGLPYFDPEVYSVRAGRGEHGTTSTVSCRDGYSPVNGTVSPMHFSCMFGSYQGDIVCEPSPCDLVGDLGAAYVVTGDGHAHHGSSVTVECAPGYSSTVGFRKEVLPCDFGVRPDMELECSASACGTFRAPNGDTEFYTVSGRGTGHGASVELACATGHTAVMGSSPETLECRTGAWDEPTLRCFPTQCEGNIPDMEGTQVMSSGQSYLDELIISCLPGYSPTVGSSPVIGVCNMGEWDFSGFLLCSPSPCMDYPLEHDFRWIVSGAETGLEHGATRTVQCADGYDPMSEGMAVTIQCNLGAWEQVPFACLAPSCGTLPPNVSDAGYDFRFAFMEPEPLCLPIDDGDFDADGNFTAIPLPFSATFTTTTSTTLNVVLLPEDADQDYLISCRDGFAPWNNSYTISSDGTVTPALLEWVRCGLDGWTMPSFECRAIHCGSYPCGLGRGHVVNASTISCADSALCTAADEDTCCQDAQLCASHFECPDRYSPINGSYCETNCTASDLLRCCQPYSCRAFELPQPGVGYEIIESCDGNEHGAARIVACAEGYDPVPDNRTEGNESILYYQSLMGGPDGHRGRVQCNLGYWSWLGFECAPRACPRLEILLYKSSHAYTVHLLEGEEDPDPERINPREPMHDHGAILQVSCAEGYGNPYADAASIIERLPGRRLDSHTGDMHSQTVECHFGIFEPELDLHCEPLGCMALPDLGPAYAVMLHEAGNTKDMMVRIGTDGTASMHEEEEDDDDHNDGEIADGNGTEAEMEPRAWQFDHTSVALVKCAPGYVLADNETELYMGMGELIHCDFGVWTSILMECVPKSCRGPPRLGDAYKVLSGGPSFEHGSEWMINCSDECNMNMENGTSELGMMEAQVGPERRLDGHVLEEDMPDEMDGNETEESLGIFTDEISGCLRKYVARMGMQPSIVQCLLGEYTPDLICVPRPCGNFPLVHRAYKVTGEGLEHGDWRLVACAHGYSPRHLGMMTTTMEEDHHMDNDEHMEEDHDRRLDDHMDDGDIDDDDEDDHHERPALPADGSMEISTCIHGAWERPMLMCEPSACGPYVPPAPSAAYMARGEGYEHGHGRIVSCSSGHIAVMTNDMMEEEEDDHSDDVMEDAEQPEGEESEDGGVLQEGVRLRRRLQNDGDGPVQEIINCSFGEWPMLQRLRCIPQTCNALPVLSHRYIVDPVPYSALSLVSIGGHPEHFADQWDLNISNVDDDFFVVPNGTSLQVDCAMGYVPIAGAAPSRMECAFGRWELGLECGPTPCGDYVMPFNESMYQVQQELMPDGMGSQLTLSCSPGHMPTLAGMQRFELLRCLPDLGVYEEVHLRCRPSPGCGSLPTRLTRNAYNRAEANIDLEDLFGIDDAHFDVFAVSCAPGYSRTGGTSPEIVYCREEQWVRQDRLICEPLPCGPFVAPEDADPYRLTVLSGSGEDHNSELEVTCAPGYMPWLQMNTSMQTNETTQVGDVPASAQGIHVRCQLGQWQVTGESTDVQLACLPEECPRFPNMGPAYVVDGPHQDLHHGTWRAVSCNPSRYMSEEGHPSATIVWCQTGMWTSLNLECEPKPCGMYPLHGPGYNVSIRGMEHGDEALVRCNRGYVGHVPMEDMPDMGNMSNGTDNETGMNMSNFSTMGPNPGPTMPPPEDTSPPTMAPTPKPAPNMSDMPGNMSGMGDNLTDMEDNMTRGNMSNMSDDDHNMDDDEAVGNMSNMTNMTRPPGHDDEDGDDDDDFRDDRFEWSEAYCEYGEWTQPLHCTEAPCQPYVAAQGYRVLHGQGHESGAWRVLECSPGFVSSLLPLGTAWCDRGEWQPPTNLSCQPADCGVFEAVEFTVTAGEGNTVHGSTVTVACAFGYDGSLDEETLRCRHGQWEQPSLPCVPSNCSAFPDTGPTYTVIGAGSDPGDWRAVSCATGFEPLRTHVHPALVHCHGGMWETLELACVPPNSNVGPVSANVTGSMTISLDLGNTTNTSNLTSDVELMSAIRQAIVDSLLADGITVLPQDIVLDLTLARRLAAAIAGVRGGAAQQFRRLTSQGLVVNYVVQTEDVAVAEAVQESINGASANGTSSFSTNLVSSLRNTTGFAVAGVEVSAVVLETQTTTSTSSTTTSTTTGCPIATTSSAIMGPQVTTTDEDDGFLGGAGGLVAVIIILGCIFVLLTCCVVGICVLVHTQRQEEEKALEAKRDEIKAAYEHSLQLQKLEVEKLRELASEEPSRRLQGAPPTVVEGKLARTAPTEQARPPVVQQHQQHQNGHGNGQLHVAENHPHVPPRGYLEGGNYKDESEVTSYLNKPLYGQALPTRQALPPRPPNAWYDTDDGESQQPTGSQQPTVGDATELVAEGAAME